MRFYVPTIGDKVYLLEPWTFTVHREGRNDGFAKKMGVAEMLPASRTWWQIRQMRKKGSRLSWNNTNQWTDVPEDY